MESWNDKLNRPARHVSRLIDRGNRTIDEEIITRDGDIKCPVR